MLVQGLSLARGHATDDVAISRWQKQAAKYWPGLESRGITSTFLPGSDHWLNPSVPFERYHRPMHGVPFTELMSQDKGDERGSSDGERGNGDDYASSAGSGERGAEEEDADEVDAALSPADGVAMQRMGGCGSRTRPVPSSMIHEALGHGHCGPDALALALGMGADGDEWALFEGTIVRRWMVLRARLYRWLQDPANVALLPWMTGPRLRAALHRLFADGVMPEVGGAGWRRQEESVYKEANWFNDPILFVAAQMEGRRIVVNVVMQDGEEGVYVYAPTTGGVQGPPLGIQWVNFNHFQQRPLADPNATLPQDQTTQ